MIHQIRLNDEEEEIEVDRWCEEDPSKDEPELLIDTKKGEKEIGRRRN